MGKSKWGVWVDRGNEVQPLNTAVASGLTHEQASVIAEIVYYEQYRPEFADCDGRIYLRTGFTLFPFRPAVAFEIV